MHAPKCVGWVERKRYPSIASYGDDGFRRLNPSYALSDLSPQCDPRRTSARATTKSWTTGVSCKETSDQTGYPTLTVNRKIGDVRAAGCETTRLPLRR